MNFYQPHECVKSLDSYSRAEQIWVLDRLAFGYYLRKGYVPEWIVKFQKLAVVAPLNFKFNPNHDPSNGQFTFGPGGDDEKDPDAITPVYPVETLILSLYGGEVLATAREALGLTEGAAAAEEGAAATEAGLTDHGALRLGERDITPEEAQKAIQTAQQAGEVITQMGKYGTPQLVYKGSNGVTAVVETTGRNAGKIITLYRH